MTDRNKHIKVALPWPNRLLSPNARINWRARHSIARTARRVGFYAAFEKHKGFAKPKGSMDVQLVLHPATRRSRDEDNIIASMKSYLDGIADALQINDARFHFKEVVWKEVKRPPEVEVHIWWKE